MVHRTSRWTTIGLDEPRALGARRQPIIFCFWHGRMMMLPAIWEGMGAMHMLISEHRDGRLIARTIRHFGIRTIAGSSSRGGAAALRAILKALSAGDGAGFTPDGPRGPRMRASLGVVHAARLTGAPIFPVAYSTTRRRILGSWDRFLLPLPFGRAVLLVGPPIRVSRDADSAAQEAARSEVEERLNQLTTEADRQCGWPPIEPASLAARAPAPMKRAAAGGGAP